jgi:hypothetical protein
MRTFTRVTRPVFVALLLAGCGTSTDESGSLAAPTNLSVTYLQDPTSWHYTFNFNAVESAESYLIYYSSTNDHSTAAALAAGQFAPISYTYLKANEYGGGTYYFWVRAYDGKQYGDWSTPVSGILN